MHTAERQNRCVMGNEQQTAAQSQSLMRLWAATLPPSTQVCFPLPEKSLPVLSGIDLLHRIQADLFQTGWGSVKVQPSANLPASVSYCLWDLISGVQWLEHSNEIPDDTAFLFHIFLVKVALALTSRILQPAQLISVLPVLTVTDLNDVRTLKRVYIRFYHHC